MVIGRTTGLLSGLIRLKGLNIAYANDGYGYWTGPAKIDTSYGNSEKNWTVSYYSGEGYSGSRYSVSAGIRVVIELPPKTKVITVSS